MNQTPKLPTLPTFSDSSQQQYFQGLHEVVSGLLASTAAPNAPTNLTVSSLPGGNTVQFTRSNAISYVLFMGNSADRSQATQVNLGSTNSYIDNVGRGAVARYYWVQGLSQSGTPSTITGPKSGTTGALGTAAPPLPIIPESYATVYDTTLGRNRPVISTVDTEVAGQPTPGAS